MFNFIKSLVGSLVGQQMWEKEGYSCEEEWLYSEQLESEESSEAPGIDPEWCDDDTLFWGYFLDQQRYEIQCIPDVWEYDNMVGVGNPFDVEDLNF